MLEVCQRGREGARGGCGALSLLEVYIYIYTARDRERYAVIARNMLERARGSERRGVVICKVLGVHKERDRCAVSA